MDFDYRLLAKYLTGMLSPEEMKQVEEWHQLIMRRFSLN